MFELLFTQRRHDNSLTEQEKIEFRNSPEWKQHRQKVADSQNGLDYITQEPLANTFHCHHIVMHSSEYKNLNNSFVALNSETHSKVHEYYTRYYSDRDGWTAWKSARKNTIGIQRFIEVVEKMFKLNDDVESVLFQNRIEYTTINAGNKLSNALLAKQLHIPTRNGMIMWNEYYLRGTGVPQDTEKWVDYVTKLNGKDKLKQCLELRHAGLYSSYRNFRNNPNMREETKNQCRKELEKTTTILRTL